jgi:hypothetical protein
VGSDLVRKRDGRLLQVPWVPEREHDQATAVAGEASARLKIHVGGVSVNGLASPKECGLGLERWSRARMSAKAERWTAERWVLTFSSCGANIGHPLRANVTSTWVEMNKRTAPNQASVGCCCGMGDANVGGG